MTLWERVVGVFRRLRGAAREGKASLRPGKGVEAGGSELPGGTAEGLELREGGAFPATARGGGSGGGAFPAAAVAEAGAAGRFPASAEARAGMGAVFPASARYGREGELRFPGAALGEGFRGEYPGWARGEGLGGGRFPAGAGGAGMAEASAAAVLAGPMEDGARALAEVLRAQRRMSPTVGSYGEDVL